MARKKHHTPTGTPAIAVVQSAGVAHQIHEFPHGSDNFGAEAAAHLLDELGIDANRVYKTLVVELSGGSATGTAPGSAPQLGVAVVPVTRRLSLKKAARALGAAKARMADPAAAERSSGYVTGGISPLGQKRTLPTVIDSGALTHPTIFVSGGRRGLDLELAGADLVALAGASAADLLEER